jgi:hypothetical protein
MSEIDEIEAKKKALVWAQQKSELDSPVAESGNGGNLGSQSSLANNVVITKSL